MTAGTELALHAGWSGGLPPVVEDAIMRTPLARPVSVVILGGGHDLTDNIERLAPGCEYIPVATPEYLRLAE